MTTTATAATTAGIGAGLAAVGAITENPFAELGVIGALGFMLFWVIRQKFTDGRDDTARVVTAIESLETVVRKTRKDAGRTQIMMLGVLSRALEIVEKNNGESEDVTEALESTKAALTQVAQLVKDSSGYTETR